MDFDSEGTLMGNYAKWHELVGRQVHIQKDGYTIRTGRVEAVTVTADALWIERFGIEQRALYEKAEGHTVLPVSGQIGASA